MPLFCFSGPNRGHYITIVKSHGFWLLFDDDIVEVRLKCELFLFQAMEVYFLFILFCDLKRGSGEDGEH